MMTFHRTFLSIGKIVFTVLLYINLVSCSDYFSSNFNRLLETYNSQNPKVCEINRTSGQCMFVWDCHKSDGISLGLCKLDTSIYGTCCYHNETLNEVITSTSPTSLQPDVDYNESSQNVDVEVSEEAKLPSSTTVTPYSECGISELDVKAKVTPGVTSLLKSRNAPESRIVGGEPASIGQWPWVASIRRASLFGYSSIHSCGSVIVNENWIVTAAHCVAALSKSLIRVRFGDLDFKSDEDNKQGGPFIERKVEQKIIYPTYNYSSFENDLALVKLSAPVTYSPNIRPLCLPKSSRNEDEYIGKNATIVGWGRISENGQYSQKQLHVQVPILSNAACVNMFKDAGRTERIPVHFICAGYVEGGRDGCQGDSGGPLTVKDSEGRWLLVGIMSWGIGCGEPQQPGVYTRISLFTDWILQHAI